MNNPKNRLKQLIEELRLPMDPEEVEENLSKLSDEQVESLVYRYEQVKSYQDEMDLAAKDESPEEFEKTTAEFDDKESELEIEHLSEMKEIQSKEDEQIDEAEEIYSKDLVKIQEESEEVTGGVIDVMDQMTGEAKKQVGKQN